MSGYPPTIATWPQSRPPDPSGSYLSGPATRKAEDPNFPSPTLFTPSTKLPPSPKPPPTPTPPPPHGRATHAIIPTGRLHPPLRRPSPPLPPPGRRRLHVQHLLLLHLGPLQRPPRLRRRRGAAAAAESPPPAREPRGRRGALRPPRRVRQPPPAVPSLPHCRVEPARRDHLRRLRAVAPGRRAPPRVPPHARRWRRRARLGLRRRPCASAGRAGAHTPGMPVAFPLVVSCVVARCMPVYIERQCICW